MAEPRHETWRTWLVAIAACAFLTAWIWVFVLSLAVSRCGHPRYDAEDRIGACNFAVAIGLPLEMDWRGDDPNIFAARGLVLSDLGRDEEAVADFRKALAYAMRGEEPADVFERPLGFERMRILLEVIATKREDSPARRNFVAAYRAGPQRE